jgi:hypothetical protein
MWETIKKEWSAKIILVIFLLLTIWWLILLHSGFQDISQNYFFAAVYGIVALLGGIWGLQLSKKWGGRKSTIGKAIIMLSLGLLAEEFGQIVFSYYNIFLKVEIPYPSIADIGFFGNIPLYIIGIILLGNAAGIKFSLRKFSSKLQLILLPIIGLSFSYYFFLKGYTFDWSQPLKVFLDFGYPLGQALYISIAILVYSLSNKLLGGIMKKPIIFIIIGFIVQYCADYNFLFQNSNQTWINGGYGDYLYLIAYFVMTFGILEFGSVVNKLKNK